MSATTILVAGSNLAGRHGAGSALHAREHYGARLGVGVGRTGDAYMIPTKDARLRVMPLEAIAPHVATFLAYAAEHSHLTFRVVAIGCGLAGYKPEQIAPMFAGAGDNVQLPPEFRRVLKTVNP